MARIVPDNAQAVEALGATGAVLHVQGLDAFRGLRRGRHRDELVADVVVEPRLNGMGGIQLKHGLDLPGG